MKITKISIDNFRGLTGTYIRQPDDQVNLFIGINGAGKSSILDAISCVLSWFNARMLSPKGRGRDIPADDISIHSPNGCTIELGIDGNEVWKLYRSLKHRKTDKSDLSSLNKTVMDLRDLMDEKPKASLPIVVHYGVNRAIPNKYPRMPRGKGEISQLDAYRNTLVGGQMFSEFFKWFRMTEDYENEQYKSNPRFKDKGLEAVRSSISQLFPGYSDLKVTRRPLALTMRKGDDVFKINQLSDGEKCYVSLVADIARRLSIANPSLQNPLMGEGIVLIDEIDLHLHPKWQQSVVSKLVEIFPNCQFFLTTHSPIVASDVQGKVYAVKDGVVSEIKTYGRQSSEILATAFDLATTRSLGVQDLFDKAYGAINTNDQKAYDDKMTQLVTILGADDADVVGVKIEKFRREKLLGK